MTQPPIDPEERIRAEFMAGRLEAAATATLEAYGSELLSFLASRLRARSDAHEAFSMFAEDLWLGLPKFGWRCSIRTWSYTLARNAASRYASAPQQRHERNVPLSCSEALSALIERARSSTKIYQRTEIKDRFRTLREQLDPEDQTLLVLRVDRGMAWRDLAITMLGDADVDDGAIEREAARLRKTFERVKAELKRLAEREGLLKSKS
jgi:RNA polymerase sigma-70 factor (ECF subfamily)